MFIQGKFMNLPCLQLLTFLYYLFFRFFTCFSISSKSCLSTMFASHPKTYSQNHFERIKSNIIFLSIGGSC